MSFIFKYNFSLGRLLTTAILLLGAALPARAEKEAEPPRKEISDEVSSELGKLKEKIDAKDYAGALKLLDGILAKADPKSYDTAMVSQLKVQILLTDGKYEEAIAPLLTANALGEKYGYYERKTQLDQIYLLCQIHYQLAAEAKDPAKQAELYAKSYAYIHRWLESSPKPTAEAALFAASILYGHATLNPSKPDQELLNLARTEASNGLYLAIKPPDQLYVLLLASLQQIGDQKAAVDVLEFLVKRSPTNALYWQQLAGAYLNLAASAKEEREIRKYQVRAILTLKRAQDNAIMNSPKDNINLIGLYFNIEQYGKASELLSDGLVSGKVENTRGNWELLSLAYQQSSHEDLAIKSLEHAAELFPTEGELELTLGQMTYGAGQVEAAHHHLDRAITKGNLKKPGSAMLFLAFTAHELQKYDEAAKWAEAASQHPDVKTEDAKRLKRAALEAIKERESLKNVKI